jgi:hypothetical protein
MTRKAAPKPTVDPEEYKRFLEIAKQIEASEDPKEFDKAFKKVTGRPAKNEKH